MKLYTSHSAFALLYSHYNLYKRSFVLRCTVYLMGHKLLVLLILIGLLFIVSCISFFFLFTIMFLFTYFFSW